MMLRLLDTLLPATTLAAMVMAMASAFGALAPAADPATTRMVQLAHVTITPADAPEVLAAAAVAAIPAR